MALLDHSRTWHFKLDADPKDCLRAFSDALRGKSLFSARKANWDISTDINEHGLPMAVGSYLGRGGMMKGVTLMSGRASEVEELASGSKLTFSVESHDPDTGMTRCAMWMILTGKQFGLTADAGFYRSYMNDVAKKLAELDPSLQVAKA